jgi:hypothetical protein
MVEKGESLYDATSSTTPLVGADYLSKGNEPIVSATDIPACQRVDFDVKPSSDDQENIQFAGIGSAVVGLIVGGPILAAIFGFGAVYAAERNADVRNKFGDVWANLKRFDKKHNVVKRGVNSIGKGTVWLIDKITGKEASHGTDTVDSWVAAQPVENKK